MDTTTTATTYQTPNGPKTIDQMKSELATAGYNGPTDDASIIATYNQTALGTSSGGSSSSTSSAQNLLDAIASGDQQKFDEAVREFNATNALAQQKQYGDLAANLLSTAANLRGPADYYQFWNYAHGGQDLMHTLYGNQAAPAFAGPSGTTTPESISTLMNQLGITSPVSGTAAAVGATTGGAPGQYNTVNGWKTVDQMYNELKAAGWGGSASDTNGIIAAYASTTKGAVTPYSAPTTTTTTPATTSTPTTTTSSTPTVATEPSTAPVGGISQAAILAGYPTASSLPTSPTPSSSSDLGSSLYPAAAVAPSPAPATATAPSGVNAAPPASGNQVDPAVWDSLGTVGQGLVKSAIDASGGDFGTWLAQLNASRPQGTAPSASTTSFAATRGSY